jgi:hypothetical protein
MSRLSTMLLLLIICFWRNSPTRARAASCLLFLHHTHNYKPQSVGLLSNPRSQQARGRKPSPSTARPLLIVGSYKVWGPCGSWWYSFFNYCFQNVWGEHRNTCRINLHTVKLLSFLCDHRDVSLSVCMPITNSAETPYFASKKEKYAEHFWTRSVTIKKVWQCLLRRCLSNTMSCVDFKMSPVV